MFILKIIISRIVVVANIESLFALQYQFSSCMLVIYSIKFGRISFLVGCFFPYFRKKNERITYRAR